jgi:hypothetical protein
MNRHVLFRILLLLVLVGTVIGVGALAFNAGVTQGIALGAQPSAGDSAQALHPGFPLPYGRPWVGFGGLLCFGVPMFFLFLFLVFGAARAFSGRGHWVGHAMHHGPWGTPPEGGNAEWAKTVPPILDEWHRRAHAAPAEESTKV